MKLIDTHSHIYEPEFDEDRDEVIARAINEGLEYLLFPAIDPTHNEMLFSTAKKNPAFMKCMMGLHPTSVSSNWKEDLFETYCALKNIPMELSPVCAIGEIGLDLYWSTEFKEEQEEVFRTQLEWASEMGKPVSIHTRNAWTEMKSILKDFRHRGLFGVMHAFSSTVEDFREISTYGDFYFGIGGVVTFKKSPLAEVLKDIPLDRIVLETDCPYLTPVPFRGTRNESSYIKYICEKVAQIKGVGPEEVANQTTKTAKNIFSLI
ncbi:MAG: TatD family hydrolase [Alistipes sp.]|nr:TatD family hydrolase [Candidatus Alistipes equi]